MLAGTEFEEIGKRAGFWADCIRTAKISSLHEPTILYLHSFVSAEAVLNEQFSMLLVTNGSSFCEPNCFGQAATSGVMAKKIEPRFACVPSVLPPPKLLSLGTLIFLWLIATWTIASPVRSAPVRNNAVLPQHPLENCLRLSGPCSIRHVAAIGGWRHSGKKEHRVFRDKAGGLV